ncbi:hypothetical protein A2U01_0094497, partial [Trifolium medium]|nr:hypothetical protein [Trifolium medium]
MYVNSRFITGVDVYWLSVGAQPSNPVERLL